MKTCNRCGVSSAPEPARDRWLSLVTPPMPDITPDHGRRILAMDRPSELRLPEGVTGIF